MTLLRKPYEMSNKGSFTVSSYRSDQLFSSDDSLTFFSGSDFALQHSH
jgi:hypothetical protein